MMFQFKHFFSRNLPAWIIGVVASFALPDAFSPLAWWLMSLVLLMVIWRFRVLLPLLMLFLGLTFGVYRTQLQLVKQLPASDNAQNIALIIRVADLPKWDNKRVSFTAWAIDEMGVERKILLSDYAKRDWQIGARYRVQVRARALIGERNIRGFNREAWALANGLSAVATVGKTRELMPSESLNWFSDGILAWRARLSANWQSWQNGEWADGASLIRALSLGEQGALSDKLWQAFRPLGLNHLISISGLHVSMVGLLAAWLMKRLLMFVPFSFARPRLVMMMAGLLAATIYSALAGFAVPTLRSLLMLTAVAVGWLHNGASSAWRGWWFALGVVLLFDPSAVLAAGSWLSFGLVAALLWAGSWRLSNRGWHNAVKAQWAATWASVLIAGHLFASLPVISPLVNALAIPWFTMILVPLALLTLIVPFYPVQYLAVVVAEYTLRVLVWLANLAPEWGMAAVPLPLLILAVFSLMLVLLPRGLGLRGAAWLVLAGLLVYQPKMPSENHLRVVVLDVGQGLSVLFQTASKQLLFDTGTAGAAQMQTLPALRGYGVRRLDSLVLSHHDIDHDGGFPLIKQYLMPSEIWAGQSEFYPQAKSCHHAHAWQWDGVHFEWLAVHIQNRKDDNDHSCVLRVVAGTTAVLVTGDLGATGEAALVEKYGENLFSQVLILGHHGSKNSSSSDFIHAVSPQFAVASSGFANPYRHPDPAVQLMLSAHRVPLLRTDHQGAWQFYSDGKTIIVQQVTQRFFYWQRKPF